MDGWNTSLFWDGLFSGAKMLVSGRVTGVITSYNPYLCTVPGDRAHLVDHPVWLSC